MIRAPATVHVVDDDVAILESFTALFESVGLAAKVYDAPEKFLAADAVEPGCLVLDVRMPGMTGYELFREVRERHPDLPVLFVTAHGQVRSAVQAIKDGAVDFLEKPVTNEELLERVEAALERGRRLAAQERRRREACKQLDQLTDRECEILRWVCEGLTSKEISAKCGIAVKTVEVHRSHIMGKMKAANVADLVRRVAAAGIQPEELRRRR